MSEKRRDKRNRILHNGETQRADGRYRFTYQDTDGNTKDVYSWRLDHNDPYPKGKRKDLSLREKEKQIEQDMFHQIVSNGGNYTVLSLVEKYVSLKTGVRHNTKAGYQTVINVLKKDVFGSKRIDKVKLSDAKAWLIKLQQEDGRGYSSIHSIRGVLRPAFQMAENDILFHTGLRISEFCGLTLEDIDFKEKRIRVNHQLQRTSKMEYVIEVPKTESGVRYVPMTDDVAECFQRIIKNRIAPSAEPTVDGYTGFLFLDKNDMPMVALHWEKYMQHIREKYNSIFKVPMPKVTPHVCRHTFCSNMAKSGMNPKTLQYIMGHSDISVTLNTYTHVNFEDAKDELERILS